MAYDIELDSMSIYTHLIHQGYRNNVPDKDFSKRSSMKTLTFDLEYYSMSPHTPYLQANFYLFNFFLEGGLTTVHVWTEKEKLRTKTGFQ